MAETEHSQLNIAAIRTRLDNLERMTRLAIASNPSSQTYIEDLLRHRAGSSEIYLALEDGPKSLEELMHLSGKSRPTVSKICTYLHESGIIDRVPIAGRVLWMWHDMERTLGISRVARRVAGHRQKEKAGNSHQDPTDIPTD